MRAGPLFRFFGGYRELLLTSEKVDYIYSKSKLLIKALFQIKG